MDTGSVRQLFLIAILPIINAITARRTTLRQSTSARNSNESKTSKDRTISPSAVVCKVLF